MRLCKRGHEAQRGIKCKECTRIRNNKYYANVSDETKADRQRKARDRRRAQRATEKPPSS